ncbi:hypothetical protein PRIPAC_77032 [Pristionchus pacificus]|uniref:G protein-coupled receptor n=1 Tax=Pristionchus pacificus TaxID=54126 RepID=A0A2A6C2A9_PRIPA|nr:hypothetical protein PRIPAC_77032 [Pristionchus pacificus]|eukprot:PDM72276.1 G protein-coupled receptor [Pristionchus pacificus]
MLFLTVFVLDSTTIIVNFTAARYCKRRYRALDAPKSLNARYQAKEAFELAKSMQPAFFTIYLAKTLLAIILLSFCYKMDEHLRCVPFLFPATFADLEVLFFMTHTILSTLLIAWLMLKHPRFRRKINSKGGDVLKRLHIQYEAPVGDKVPEGDLYFETLEASWNVAHAVAQRKKSRSWIYHSHHFDDNCDR